jgi:hypothetical protein
MKSTRPQPLQQPQRWRLLPLNLQLLLLLLLSLLVLPRQPRRTLGRAPHRGLHSFAALQPPLPPPPTLLPTVKPTQTYVGVDL